jgi:ribose transport system ATP-binding protein
MTAIAKLFGPTVALARVDLEARGGEILAVLGENGAGKSTLMKVLAGATQPDSGTMTMRGAGSDEPYVPRSPADARARGVAMIYQELSLAPHLTVEANLLLGREPAHGGFLSTVAARERARAALEAVGHADLPLDAEVRALSPAHRQIVEIARALALESRVLVLDEPTSSLAAPDVARLHALLRDLRARGLAIVYISHDLEEVLALADRFLVLRDGRSVAAGAIAGVDARTLVAHMAGRTLADARPRERRAPGEVVLRIESLAGKRLPRSATLEIRRGEIVGIAGLVGAGRTELLRAVFGLDAIAGGSIEVLGESGPSTPRARWSRGLGMLSEDRAREGLALGLSVAENVTLASLDRVGRSGFAPRTAVEEAARPWIEKLRVRCSGPGALVRALSGGNQQKVALARLLAADCDLLLLDEPTRGIDVGAKAEIHALLDALVRGEGRRPEGTAAHGNAPSQRAVLLASSDLDELLALCDRIAVMVRGTLGPARPARALDRRAILLEASGGGAA